VLGLTRVAHAPQAGPRPPVLAQLAVGFKVVMVNPKLVALMGMTMGLNLVFGVVVATNPAVAKGELGVSDVGFATIGTVAGVSGALLLFALPILLRRVSPIVLARGSFGLMVAAGLLLGLGRTFPLLVFGFSCLTCAIGVFNVFVRTERAKVIPRATFGRAMGVVVLFNRLGLPLAGLAVAAGTRLTDPRTVVLATTALVTMSSLAFLLYVTRPAGASLETSKESST
jgi:hypothetical protein